MNVVTPSKEEIRMLSFTRAESNLPNFTEGESALGSAATAAKFAKVGLREVPGALRLIDDPENLPKALGSLKQLTNLQVEFDASFPIQKLHSDTTWIPEGVTEVAARVKLLQEGLNLASRLGQATDAKEFGVRARRLVMGMESAVLERKSNASVPSPSSVLDEVKSSQVPNFQ